MSEKQASTTDINRLVKKLTGKLVKDQESFGLSPFYTTTPPPEVNYLTLVFRLSSCYTSTPLWSDFIFLDLVQLTYSWWSPNNQDARAESNEGIEEEN